MKTILTVFLLRHGVCYCIMLLKIYDRLTASKRNDKVYSPWQALKTKQKNMQLKYSSLKNSGNTAPCN